MKILEIKLRTSRLPSLKAFYSKVLELPIVDASEDAFTVQVGASQLTFMQQEMAIEPYYHYAFNITESKMDAAVAWLQARGIALNRIDQNETYYSASWDSHSAYFYDPAGNIVEFIARHTVRGVAGQDAEAISGPVLVSEDEFTSVDMLNISEIGLPANDVTQLSAYLQAELSETIYKNNNAMFTAIGDEEGLLILSSLARNWLGSNKKVVIFPLEIVAGCEGRAAQAIGRVLDYPYQLSTC